MGGVQRVTDILGRELNNRGYNVYYLCSNTLREGVNYTYTMPQFFIDQNKGKQSIREAYQSLIKEKKINVVINQQPCDELLDLLALTPPGVKKITCYHLQPFFTQGNARYILKYHSAQGWKSLVYSFFCRLFPNYYYRQTLKLARNVFRNTLNVSDKLCLLSERFIPRLLDYMPEAQEKKIFAVNNPNTFSSEVSDLKTLKEKLVLWVGRHDNPQKNFPLFVDFWINFQKYNPDWKALVLGSGRHLEYNKKYALRNNTKNLEFLGSVENVETYYKRASFLVMTSIYEGWGMILTEAMNYGCIPCVFDTYESLRDIIDDDTNGIIVPKFNYRLLTSRIEELMNGSEKFSLMQVAANKKIEAFTKDKIVDQWELLLKSLY